jgi:dCTP deaminase
MTVLADQDIGRELAYGDLDVSPVDLDEQLQPNSLDIRLSDGFCSVIREEKECIDVKEGNFSLAECKKNDFIINPGEFLLADTIETFKIPDYLYGQVHGRSSIGRLGIEIHSTAGLIDSGYRGSITLEITNNSNNPIKLYNDMRIAQVVFHRLESKCNNPYSCEDNKYQGQEGVTRSRISQDFQ